MLETLIDQKEREIERMENTVSQTRDFPASKEFFAGLKSRKTELPKMKAALAAYKKAGGK